MPYALNALDAEAAPRPLAVFHLRGTQADMGEQHGRLLRAIGGFEPSLAYYPRMAEEMLRGSQNRLFDRVMPSMLRPVFELLLRRLEGQRDPELLARSRAFYTALGVSPGTARYLMAMDLFQNAVGLAGRYGKDSFIEPWTQRGMGACSTLAAWGAATEDGRLLHGRNFDFPGAGIWDAAPTLVFCSPDSGMRYGFAATRGADLPGITAFNEAGLVLTMHTRLHADVAFSGMAAVDLGHAVVRQARTLAEAVTILTERPSASTWGLLVSSAAERRAVLVETTAKGTAVSDPHADEPFLTCTNHFRHADLHDGELLPCIGWLPYSGGRMQRLQNLAHEALNGRKLDVATLRTWLGDRHDADDPTVERLAGGVLAQPIGVQSIVADGERGTIDVSIGRCPSGRGSYQTVAWDWTLPVGVEERPISTPMPAGAPSRFDQGPAAEALRLFMRASQLEARGGKLTEITGALDRAAALDPAESTLQLLAGGCALRRGDWTEALRLFDQGLATEKGAFHRGRLLHWAARTADVMGERTTAATFRAELASLSHKWLGPVQLQAKGDCRKPVPAATLRVVPLHIQLGDIG